MADVSSFLVYRERKIVSPFTLNEQNELNWASLGIVRPSRDQKKCNCCWAIVAADNIACLWRKYKSEDLENSPQQLVDCVPPRTNQTEDEMGCYRSTINRGFRWIIQHGISLEKDYPFQARRGTCNMQIPKYLRLKGYETIIDDDNDHSQEKLFRKVMQHPVAAVVEIFEDLINLKEGIYGGPTTFPTKFFGLHAIQVIGFGRDEEEKKNYWYVLNSYGNEWGVNGISKVDRGVILSYEDTYRPLVFMASYPVLIDDQS